MKNHERLQDIMENHEKQEQYNMRKNNGSISG